MPRPKKSPITAARETFLALSLDDKRVFIQAALMTVEALDPRPSPKPRKRRPNPVPLSEGPGGA